MRDFRLPGRPGPIQLRARVVRAFRAGAYPVDIADEEWRDIGALLTPRQIHDGGDVCQEWVLDAIRMGLRPGRRRWS